MPRNGYLQCGASRAIPVLAVLLFLLGHTPAPGQTSASSDNSAAVAQDSSNAMGVSPSSGQNGSADSAVCPMCGAMMKGNSGWMMPVMMIGGLLFWLALLAVLISLAVFLIRRSRPSRENS